MILLILFLALTDVDVVKSRMAQELEKYGVKKEEVEKAADKAWDEWTAFRNDMRTRKAKKHLSISKTII